MRFFELFFVPLHAKACETAHVLTPEGMSVALRAVLMHCIIALAQPQFWPQKYHINTYLSWQQ